MRSGDKTPFTLKLYVEVRDRLYALYTLYSEDRIHDTRWTGGWVGHKDGLELDTRYSVVQPAV
jgi:hypothetical protein